MTIITNDGRLFVAIPRSGSTSMEAQLEADDNIRGHFAEKHGGLAYSRKYAEDLASDWNYNTPEAQLVREVNVAELEPFCVIRNPWEWFASMYFTGVSAAPSRFEKDIWPGGLIEPADNPTTVHNYQRTGLTFEDYVKQRRTTQRDWALDIHGQVGIEPKNILRLEDVRKDFTVHRSEGGGPPYQQMFVLPMKGWRQYTPQPNQPLIDYVARKCAWEIEVGGYTFEPLDQAA